MTVISGLMAHIPLQGGGSEVLSLGIIVGRVCYATGQALDYQEMATIQIWKVSHGKTQ